MWTPIFAILCSVWSSGQQGQVAVPFRETDDAIFVDAKVNGRTVSMLFDTGFSGSILVDTAINVGPRTGTQTLRDFVGEFEAPTVSLRSLYLGDKKIEIEDPTIIQQPQEGMSAAYGQHVDGIMGLSVVRNAITEINFQKHQFLFYPKDFDITRRTPDNKRTFLTKLLPIGQGSLEMEVLAPSGKRLTMALDTGNGFFATTHKDVLERVGLWSDSQSPKYMTVSGVASGAVESWLMKMPAITIFGVPVAQSVWSVIDRPSGTAEGDGTIGFGFLKNFNVIIDYERRRVWFENFTGETGVGPVGDVGIQGGENGPNHVTTVFHVAPQSPADAAGVQVGDQILSIDDREISSLGPRNLSKLLQGSIGSVVRLAASHHGELKRFSLTRRALVNPE